MAALMNSYIDKTVLVLTVDSRVLVGRLAGIDNSTNLILQSTVERVISTPDDNEPSTEVPLGLYLVRGDNVCSVGLVDEQLDASIDWTKVRGHAIGTTKHI